MFNVGRVWSALLVAALVLLTGLPSASLVAQPSPAVEGSGAAATEGSGGLEEEVVPSFEEEIAPVLEEEIAPSFEEEIAPVLEEEIAPSFEEEIAPALEEEIAPSFEEEIAPALEEEIAPSFEDEVVPSLEEEIAPSPSEETPVAPEDEAPAPLTPDAEDSYYDQFWDDLDKSEPVAPAPPAVVPSGKVRITGKLVDREFGTPLDGVAVEVEGIAATARTGADGTFFFDLDPGLFVVRAKLFSYATEAFEVEVLADQPADLGMLSMGVDEKNSETFVVEGRAIKENAATQLMERRESAAVSDAVSAQEMSKAPDSAASDAVKRVVGASIVDDQFLYIRGLGGRYTCVTMNGVIVRGTDPDFPGVQLDIFPSDLLSNLTVYKSFTPNLSGGCAAGQMDIGTRDYPEEWKLSLGASVAVTPGTTFGNHATYQGGSLDWLGFDDGSRALPDGFPDQRIERGRGLSDEQIAEAGRSLDNVWNPEQSTALPGMGLKATIGDSGGPEGNVWGYLLTANYNRSYSVDERTIRSISLDGAGDLSVSETLAERTDKRKARWGLLGTATKNWGDANQITFAELFSQSGSDQVNDVTTDVSADKGRPYESRRLQWVERSFSFTQLVGRHRNLFADSEVKWNANMLWAARNEPDTRYLKRDGLDGIFRWRQDPGSGERFFSELDQLDLAGGLDWKMPLGLESSLSSGIDLLKGHRAFDSRRFRFACSKCDTGDPRALDPELLFSDENIGTVTEESIGTVLSFGEETGGNDRYEVDQVMTAGYLMSDFKPLEWLRVVGGARAENYDQTVVSGSPFLGQRVFTRETVKRGEFDILPSAGLVFELEEGMFVRANYGASVARPQGREVAPFAFQDYVRRKTITGNPDLLRTYVHSSDLRWEWFPSNTEVLAASLFYKVPLHPIEQSLTQAGEITYGNAESAQSYGAEVEFRTGLSGLAKSLAALSVGANASFITSSVTVGEEQQRAATSSERPLQGQASYMVNGSLSYEPEASPISATVLYNVMGRELVTVGLLGLPDVYAEPFHKVDLTVSYELSEGLKLKGGARNLLGQSRRAEQGGVIVEDELTDTDISLSVGWEP